MFKVQVHVAHHDADDVGRLRAAAWIVVVELRHDLHGTDATDASSSDDFVKLALLAHETRGHFIRVNRMATSRARADRGHRCALPESCSVAGVGRMSGGRIRRTGAPLPTVETNAKPVPLPSILSRAPSPMDLTVSARIPPR